MGKEWDLEVWKYINERKLDEFYVKKSNFDISYEKSSKFQQFNYNKSPIWAESIRLFNLPYLPGVVESTWFSK